jgi:deazaflavin-dependent oxidoreductase (nitroreductase family)
MSSEAAEGRTARILDFGDRVWPVTRRLTRVHTFLYRQTNGRIGHRVPGGPGRMLLLDHVGAKSGIERTLPLLYVRNGEDLVVVASKGGFPKNPAWYHNLEANPETTVQVCGALLNVKARVAGPEEREALWAKAIADYPLYDEYADRSKGREIPLVVLEPRRA